MKTILPHPKFQKNNLQRIVNGQPARLGQFPYQVKLLQRLILGTYSQLLLGKVTTIFKLFLNAKKQLFKLANTKIHC